MTNLTKYLSVIVVLIIAGTVAAIAQPLPNQLADQMYEINQQRLSNIETLTITMKMDLSGYETETTTRYIKTESDGRVMLVLDEGGEEADSELLEGVYDGSVEEIIRAGESVSNDNLSGKNTYKIVINDREFLNRLGQDEFNMDDNEFEIEKATLWLDRDELVPIKMIYDQYADGSGVSVEIVMEDYRTHSGLPVTHKMSMKMEGMDQMFSDEEIAEARQAMREMEEQLAAMPPAQREMIESRMSGQIEQFEQMIESGSGGSTLMEVIDVQVNK
ncbi:hypothetical protein BH23BAC3_BH23BAC3_13940 [soil metagenome]